MKGNLRVSSVRDRMQFVTVNAAGCEQGRKVACFEIDRNHFKIQCVCVYLEISVNTRSFKNCSTQHIQFDFHSNKRNVPRNFTPQINCCAKFRFPKRNFKRNFVVRGTKSQAKFRTLARNFNDM